MTQHGVRAPNTVGGALRRKGNVMGAVMLRDMRSRFFNHGLGFLMVPLWPLAHLFIILTIHTMLGRVSPFGSSLRVFFATGLIPTLSFMYVSRFMALSLLSNGNMMAFPIVRPADILAGRAALEIIGSCMMATMTFVLLMVIGDDPYPLDASSAVAAFATTLCLAVGMGIIVGCVVRVVPFFITVYFLCCVLFYLLSGTLFVVSALPAPIAYALSWNPLLQCVEWMRVAYIPGYPDQVLDRTYAIGFALGVMFLGLLTERLMRPIILSA